MNPRLVSFYESWLLKADEYHDESLAEIFDKYITLYVIYNVLYMEVFNQFKNEGKVLPNNFRDKTAAVDYVIQFVKSSHLITNLFDNDNSLQDLASIIDMIKNEGFHIILLWGQHQRNLDLILLDKLQSPNNQKKASGLLHLFYNIRCNLFHGHKEFEEHQRHLLLPVNRLLQRTIRIIFENLN